MISLQVFQRDLDRYKQRLIILHNYCARAKITKFDNDAFLPFLEQKINWYLKLLEFRKLIDMIKRWK